MIFLLMLFVFMLAIVVGNELISKVPPTLHTPLMSGANAISGITIVGALMCAKAEGETTEQVLAIAAIALAMVNVIGGFMVTDRMLSMFATKKKGGKK
ncbi:MAG: NAD(P) transhydrogenase subunit alpha [Planctomycetota bacterium]|jgi:NAD(P) transhydrogenase subunit alpha|nr:NAD(P) transhydrogenase subunit alpha [Planctomycetota bacterium]